MKKIISIIIIILCLMGCATPHKKIITPEEHAMLKDAYQKMDDCMENRIVAIDDKISDAMTIAEALARLCSNEFEYYGSLYADVSGLEERLKGRFMNQIRNENKKIALTFVLEHRSNKVKSNP
jgi:uncharacterized protein YceK